MVKGVVDRYYWGVTRYTTSSLLRMKLGNALTDPGMAPPIKLLFCWNSDPANCVPDTITARRGLARDDLYTVVHDFTTK